MLGPLRLMSLWRTILSGQDRKHGGPEPALLRPLLAERLQPKTAFSRFSLVHDVDLERRQRVELVSSQKRWE
jgi:hypothetical protein